MTEEEIRRFLANTRVGVLAMAMEGRAYAVPLFFGYDGYRFYFHGRPGLKELFAQRTSEACLTVVSAQSEDVWSSVLAFGPLQVLTDDSEVLAAQEALMSAPIPPAWGFSEFGEPRRTERGARIWAMTPERMTGRKSVRALGEARTARSR